MEWAETLHAALLVSCWPPYQISCICSNKKVCSNLLKDRLLPEIGKISKIFSWNFLFCIFGASLIVLERNFNKKIAVCWKMLQKQWGFVANCYNTKSCKWNELKLYMLHYWYFHELHTKFHVSAATRRSAATCWKLVHKLVECTKMLQIVLIFVANLFGAKFYQQFTER